MTHPVGGQTGAVSGGRVGFNKGAITSSNFHQNVDRRGSSGGGGVQGRNSPRQSGTLYFVIIF